MLPQVVARGGGAVEMAWVEVEMAWVEVEMAWVEVVPARTRDLSKTPNLSGIPPQELTIRSPDTRCRHLAPL